MGTVADEVRRLRSLGRDILAISLESRLTIRGSPWSMKAVLGLPATLPPPLRWDAQKHFDFCALATPELGEAVQALSFRERDDAERAANVGFARALAAELRVPCFIDPPDEPHLIVSWLHQLQSRTLVALLEKSRRILVVSGRGFSPTQVVGSVGYAELHASDDARLRHWNEKLQAIEEVEQWVRTRHQQPHHDPFKALAELDRRGRLLGVIDETPFGHLQISGLRHDSVIPIHGTLHEVECLSCGARIPSAAAIAEFRATRAVPRCRCGGPQKLAVTALGQAPLREAVERAKHLAATCDLVLVLGSSLTTTPCSAIALHPVQARGTPLILIGPETDHDRDAALIIAGSPYWIFPFAMKSLTD